jgi:glycosyltransferase involved in cell wall biosynthesis
MSLTGNATAIARLRAHFKAFRPDVIHAHMVASALLASVAARGLGIPLVVTVHNSFDRQSALMRIADRVVAVSIAEYDALVHRGFRNDTLSAVVNGTEGSTREAFLAADKPIALKRPCVVTACGLHPRKGTGIVMAGFISAARDKPDWNFYILGDGPERARLERQARESGLGARIHILGFRNQPRAILDQAEIFVIGSYAEPCCLVLSEARNAGCAAIATAVGGNSELLDHGRAGRLVPPGNAAAFARELSTLMSDEGQLAAARAAAREGHKFFNLDRVRQDYESVYETTIARAAPTPRAASLQNPAIEPSPSPIAQPR